MRIDSNIGEFRTAVAQALKEIPEVKAPRALMKANVYVLNSVIAASPVDTGYLRSQWRSTRKSLLLWQDSNNTEYITDLEFGTSKSQKHVGFVRGTLAAIQKKTLSIIRGGLFR